MTNRQSMREQFDKFWEIEKHNNSVLVPRQADRISDYWLALFKEQLEVLAGAVEEKRWHAGKEDYDEGHNDAIADCASLIRTFSNEQLK